jgi:hypothetical protein
MQCFAMLVNSLCYITCLLHMPRRLFFLDYLAAGNRTIAKGAAASKGMCCGRTTPLYSVKVVTL